MFLPEAPAHPRQLKNKMAFDNLTPESIALKIKGQDDLPPFNRYPIISYSTEHKKAAVLIPMFKKDDEWHLLYIRRATVDGDFHSGQVAFPGGAMEDQDIDLEDTALRETYEEIGIPPEKVQIIGRLRSHITISSFIVTPIAALIPAENNIKLSEDEVTHVFSIPLQWLANPNNSYLKDRLLPDSSSVQVRYFNEYNGEILWGASARITLDLISNLNR